MRPFLRYSPSREAFILRGVGKRHGPVLRRERRGGSRAYDGPDRRGALSEIGPRGAAPGL